MPRGRFRGAVCRASWGFAVRSLARLVGGADESRFQELARASGPPQGPECPDGGNAPPVGAFPRLRSVTGRAWLRDRGPLPVGKVAGEVIDQIARVILGAVDEGGLASPEHGQSDGVQPGRIDNSPVMPKVAFAIDHGHSEPAVVRAKPGRPDDGTDLARSEVEVEP